MEKRALLAVLLSVVAVVVWYGLFPPSPTPLGTQEIAEPVKSVPEEGSLGPERVAVREGPREKIFGSKEETITFQGEGFRAVVSNRGGVLRSWSLLKYRDGKGAPQELVRGGVAPLSLEPAGPWNEDLWQVIREEGAVILRWADGEGLWLEKRLEVTAEYGLRVTLRALGFPGNVGMVVSSGLATWTSGGKGQALARADFVGMAGGKLRRVGVGKEEEEILGQGLRFLGAEDQYFLFVMVPEGSVTGKLQGRESVAVVEGREAVAGLLMGLPKEHKLLKSLNQGLEETLSFGLFGFFSILFLEVLRWIHGWSGNWGVGIILLTAGIRLLLFPLTHKSTVAMRRMARLAPKIKAIQERYQEKAKKDPAARQRMNQEIMELYRREGVNPMGGCLPMLVQIPILWALYTLFAFAIELRHQPFILWIRDLSAKDPTYITPILMTASMVLQQRLAPQTGDPTQRRMFMLLPFVFGFMFMNFPSGLVLYWLVNNLLTIGQQLLTERLLRGESKER